VLLLVAVAAGAWIQQSPLARWFLQPEHGIGRRHHGLWLHRLVLPVWLLLAPRDYLSAFMKIGRHPAAGSGR